MCGVKIQALVSPNGLCTLFSVGIPGSDHDLKAFNGSMWLERFLSVHMTMQNGTQIVRHFRVLFKKGYTGLNSQGYPEAIVTIKKPIGRDLTQEEIATNTRIERDRVIVENYFGRLKSDFGFLRQQYSSDRSKSFPSIMAICIALNNFYISEHPLRVAHQQNQVLMNQN